VIVAVRQLMILAIVVLVTLFLTAMVYVNLFVVKTNTLLVCQVLAGNVMAIAKVVLIVQLVIYAKMELC